MDVAFIKPFLELGSTGVLIWLYWNSITTHREDLQKKDEHIREINDKVREAFVEHARTTQSMADAMKANTEAIKNNTETIRMLVHNNTSL